MSVPAAPTRSATAAPRKAPLTGGVSGAGERVSQSTSAAPTARRVKAMAM